MSTTRKTTYTIICIALFPLCTLLKPMDLKIEPTDFSPSQLRSHTAKELNRLASCMYTQHFVMSVLISLFDNKKELEFRSDVQEATTAILKSAQVIVKKHLLAFEPQMDLKNEESAAQIFCSLNHFYKHYPLPKIQTEIKSLGNSSILIHLEKLIETAEEFSSVPQNKDRKQGLDACSRSYDTTRFLLGNYWRIGSVFVHYYEHLMVELRAKMALMRGPKKRELVYHCCYTPKMYLPLFLMTERMCECPATTEPASCKKQATTPSNKELTKATAYIGGQHVKPVIARSSKKPHHKIRNKNKSRTKVTKSPATACTKQRSTQNPHDIMDTIERIFGFENDWMPRIKAALHDTISLQRTLQEMHQEYDDLSHLMDPVLDLRNTHANFNDFDDLRHIRKILMGTLPQSGTHLKSRNMARSLKPILDAAYSDKALATELALKLTRSKIGSPFYPHTPCL